MIRSLRTHVNIRPQQGQIKVFNKSYKICQQALIVVVHVTTWRSYFSKEGYHSSTLLFCPKYKCLIVSMPLISEETLHTNKKKKTHEGKISIHVWPVRRALSWGQTPAHSEVQLLSRRWSCFPLNLSRPVDLVPISQIDSDSADIPCCTMRQKSYLRCNQQQIYIYIRKKTHNSTLYIYLVI